MSIALLGVVAMQYYFIRETYRQKSALFDEAVNTSLAKVASEIEKSEVINYARIQGNTNRLKYEAEQDKQKKLAEQLKIQRQIELLSIEQIESIQKFKEAEESLKSIFPNATAISNSFYETYYKKKQNRKYIDIKLVAQPVPNSSMIDWFVDITATKELTLLPSKDDSVRYIVSDIDINSGVIREYQVATLPPRSNEKITLKLIELRDKLNILNKDFLRNAKNVYDTIAAISGKKSGVVEDVALSIQLSNRPLISRINKSVVRTLLTNELESRDIYSPFNIEIRDRHKLIFQTAGADSSNSHTKFTRYTTALFKGDLGTPTGRLSIYFPNKKEVIVDNMSYLILPTIALFALLIGCFAYTLSIIFKQKKISEIKNDFINNMTHEFKTPVATIMIASESLKDPEIANNEKRVSKLANIIYDENVRLGNHIERVLNIAKLEKENPKIEHVQVRINELAEDVLDSMNLQLQKAGGSLQKELKATNDIVIGDELHLSNVLFNLVDNAIKYSPDKPEITVKTFNNKDNIIICVSDKGMGMNKEQQNKIFDQFYRIPTGNVHNVKGFGLGLSYVSDIIKRLNGKIQVKSEKDKGTTFEVTLPLDK
ncbi:sensor histidine kinase [Sphingobacterium rhinopitheci]|uniref:sensor histidine kinase n=1 Tax=Sphingobacterium rhinopitheci TaxID=2781960 RepID=UPI001F522EF6|nr:HAMP domain-containing sensor histidine kinase [Sphingobacterium rhinopitheci]